MPKRSIKRLEADIAREKRLLELENKRSQLKKLRFERSKTGRAFKVIGRGANRLANVGDNILDNAANLRGKTTKKKMKRVNTRFQNPISGDFF